MIDALEANSVQKGRHNPHTRTVERSIDYLHIRVILHGIRRKHQSGHSVHILLVHLLAHKRDFRTLVTRLEFHHRRVGDGVHLSHDVLVHRRYNLGTVAPKYFVTVVFLRVVRCGNHHTCSCLLLTYCEAQQGNWTKFIVKPHINSIVGKHIGCNLSKLGAVVSAVERNADRMVVARHILQDIVCKALCGHSYGVAVHTVCTHTHNTPESACTELESAIEGILKCRSVSGIDKGVNLRLCLLIIVPE